MKKKHPINYLSDKLALEFMGKDNIDFRTEISNHDIMYNENIFKIIDNYGQNKFEDLVISKIQKEPIESKDIKVDINRLKNLGIINHE